MKTAAGEEILLVSALLRSDAGGLMQSADGRLFAAKQVLGCVGALINPLPGDDETAARMIAKSGA